MLKQYKTIYNQAEVEFVEKKSKFIGYAFPVTSEEEALEHLENIRKMHFKATHNCFAYQIGENNQFKKQSDDGEPNGTAGMPILDYIQKSGLKNILIVVTRYYCGILLGTGGLVRAYGKGASMAAAAANIIEKNLHQKLEVAVPYNLSGKVEYEIRNQNYILLDILYEDIVKFVVVIEYDKADGFVKYMADITANVANITPLGLVYTADVGGKVVIV
ncbi:MAG: YigZ family protein [Defluviitaleaceae bacterium]|nr:YigZ family protein [Defluviitaleaceae bacterium]